MFAKQDEDAAIPQQGRIAVQDTLAVLYWAAAAAAWTAATFYFIWFDR
jgi:hypothetical protein